MSTLVFTTIQHEFRRKHGLSCLEYVLLDMIYHLKNHENSAIPGWCYMSREEMAKELDITKQGVIKMIGRLEKEDFLIKNPKGKYLKTTDKWNPNTNGKQSLPKPGEQSLPVEEKVSDIGKQSLLDVGKQSLPNNNNTIDNNNNNSISSASANRTPNHNVEFDEKLGYKVCRVLQQDCRDFYRKFPKRYPGEMYVEFIKWWSEPTKKGVPKWYDMKTWDLGGRLRTWKKKDDQNKENGVYERAPRPINPRDEVNPVVDPKFRMKKV